MLDEQDITHFLIDKSPISPLGHLLTQEPEFSSPKRLFGQVDTHCWFSVDAKYPLGQVETHYFAIVSP